jgi:23S rRNA (adenine2030-N6)-methyltransferase
MNYRHVFHAGNFADVHKHSVLVRILLHLRKKPAPFRIIDTHAGAGRYDLFGPDASRSAEWHTGIERIWTASRASLSDALLAPYLDIVAAFNPPGKLRAYPGSPLIVAGLLRRHDRLLACELEPNAAHALAGALRGIAGAKALAIDGWTALEAYVPPKERRGFVLVDPPFEEAADFVRLANGLAAAYRKWPTGIYMLWYPIKDCAAAKDLAKRLRSLAIANVLRCELTLGKPRADGPLLGSGLIVVNPPFTLESELRALLPALARMLSPRASTTIDWLVRQGAPTAGRPHRTGRPLFHTQKLV